MSTTMIRPVPLPSADDLEDLWNGPDPAPDPDYVDWVRVDRALNPGRAGNRDAWRYLSGAEQDALIRHVLARRRPPTVNAMAELLHVRNAAVLDMIGRLFDPFYVPPGTARRRRGWQPADDRVRTPVLAIRRPLARLTVTGTRSVESRSWSTDHRGPVYIFAGSRWEIGPVRVATSLGVDLPDRYQDPTGIIGTVDISGMCDSRNQGCECGPWAVPGCWHWLLTNPQPYTTPVPWVGRAGFGLRWSTPEETALIEKTRRYAQPNPQQGA